MYFSPTASSPRERACSPRYSYSRQIRKREKEGREKKERDVVEN
jgi:hypothetical protein